MKRLLLLFFLAVATLPAQCRLQFALSAKSTSAVFDNRNARCAGWTLEFTKTGTNATVTLELADSIQGPWSMFPGTSVATTGPITAIGSPAYVRVVRSSVGTGIVTGVLRGTAEPWVKQNHDGSVAIGGQPPAGAPPNSLSVAGQVYVNGVGLGGAALLDVGTTAGTVAAGDDPRLSDARVPVAHAASHATGQPDAIAPDLIGAAASDHDHAGVYEPVDPLIVRTDAQGNVSLGPSIAGAQLGGTLAASNKFTVTHSDAAFTVAATEVSILLGQLPANAKITGLRLKHSEAFGGGTIGTMACSLGDATSKTAYSPAFDLRQPVMPDAMHQDGGAYSTSSAAHELYLHCTADVNFGDGTATVLTAGSLDVWVDVGVWQ